MQELNRRGNPYECMSLAPDIQPIVGELARCIDMQQRWAAGCVYLHETGDQEAAREALSESDWWRDRAEAIEDFMRARRQRI